MLAVKRSSTLDKPLAAAVTVAVVGDGGARTQRRCNATISQVRRNAVNDAPDQPRAMSA